MRKGALIGLDAFNPVASIVVFQFNPEKMTRTLKPQTSGSEGSLFETQRLKGAPEETIKMELRFDAADALADGDGIAESIGLYPQLSALEMLVYPKSALVITNTVLLATGTIEVVPPTGPLTLFVWGPQRILPVQIKELSIDEENYDSNLNPITAKATLTLKVISYNEMSLVHPAYWIFLGHQIAKEVFATMGSIGNITSLDDLLA
jgi:hypothetical protein